MWHSWWSNYFWRNRKLWILSSEILFTVNCMEMTKLKGKDAWNSPFKIKLYQKVLKRDYPNLFSFILKVTIFICWQYLNLWPINQESSPITTRPGVNKLLKDNFCCFGIVGFVVKTLDKMSGLILKEKFPNFCILWIDKIKF